MKPKPTIRLEMTRSLPQGIAEIRVPQERPPPGTEILILSIEDFVAAQKALGNARYV